MPDSPHDRLFKEAFGDARNARAELRSVLPPQILARVDLSSLTPLPGSFIDEALAGSESDLLFSMRVSGRDALLYVLFEHKSAPDRWVGLQLLRYMVRIWERSLATTPGLSNLPPIIPLVVHHSSGGFTGPRRFFELMDPVVGEVPELMDLTPSFGFLLDDISHTTDAELRARSLSAFGLLAVLALRDARTPERLVEGLQRWADVLSALSHAPDGARALSLVFRYLSQVSELDLPTFSGALRAAPKAQEIIMTIAEQMRQEGVLQGRQEGVLQGRQEGVLQGRQELLAEQLRAKFGAVDAESLARLGAADASALRRYGKRILAASSLEDVFAGADAVDR